MFRYLVFLVFFVSCSEKNINSIQNYKVVDHISNQEFPRKYKISVSGDCNLENILRSLDNVEIGENGDFKIEILKSIENFGNNKLYFGTVEIIDLKTSSKEKTFAFSGDHSSLNNAYKKVVNFFSKKRGYVIEKRKDNDGEFIFKVNLGRIDGIKKDMRVDIYTYRENDSFLKETKKMRKHKIATGVVSNMINDRDSWILLENKKYAPKVSEGAFIFVKSGNFSEYILDGKLFIKTNKQIIENRLRINERN
jgi:hypothetical protein